MGSMAPATWQLAACASRWRPPALATCAMAQSRMCWVSLEPLAEGRTSCSMRALRALAPILTSRRSQGGSGQGTTLERTGTGLGSRRGPEP